MIVVDSSALIAILFQEPEGARFQAIITGRELCFLSAVNAHEVASVLRIRSGVAAVTAFWEFLRVNAIVVIAFDEAQARAASSAFDRYGKGIHSLARLNLADCAAYALASTINCPLLFKGNDFTHTDLPRVTV